MTNVFRFFAAGLLLFTMAACADDTQQQQAQQNPNASSIPWNHPQQWEGQGMMGGFSPNEEGSTGAAGH
jgi:outer membrane biogenesis lipoprotein LolB